MSHTPIGGHPQGWEHKLADRSSLPPASGEEKAKYQHKHVFAQPHLSKGGWREETEGSSGSSARSRHASPPYMRWARSLHRLLEDEEGVRLFRKYVVGAGGLHVDRLNFYFAVQGLRQETEPAKIRQVVSAIYKFLRKSQLAMPEDLKALVKQSLKDGSNIEKTIFDDMEQEVSRAITDTTYVSFLRSDAYVSYVSAATQPLSSPDADPPTPGRELVPPGPVAALATLHEGQELAPARLTPAALRATQQRRLHPHLAPHRKRSVYSAHMSYGGYCPASRQDSERASLSSGRTDSDAVSLSGGSVDGMSLRGSREPRERHRSRLCGVDRHAVINKDADTNMVIPRTQRIQSEQLRVLPPAEFAPILIEKLERVRREQETKERLERRLADNESEEAAMQSLPPQLVAAAIRDKLQLDNDNDQDILDQHVSRVWSERTPGASPPPRRAAHPRRAPPPHPHARRASSALSADSGLYDAPLSRRSLSKKTVTDITDSGVSVVSDGACVEPRVLLWIADSERAERNERSERSERSDRKHSRGSSLERDEHRRRDKARQRGPVSKSSPSSGAPAAPGAPADHTVVVLSFLDEAVPYRFKVPAHPLTLRAFKDYLPKKGNYRYFFKTECADLDNTVIQEEVSGDSDVLPMFDGKVMARVKTVE